MADLVHNAAVPFGLSLVVVCCWECICLGLACTAFSAVKWCAGVLHPALYASAAVAPMLLMLPLQWCPPLLLEHLLFRCSSEKAVILLLTMPSLPLLRHRRLLRLLILMLLLLVCFFRCCNICCYWWSYCGIRCMYLAWFYCMSSVACAYNGWEVVGLMRVRSSCASVILCQSAAHLTA